MRTALQIQLLLAFFCASAAAFSLAPLRVPVATCARRHAFALMQVRAVLKSGLLSRAARDCAPVLLHLVVAVPNQWLSSRVPLLVRAHRNRRRLQVMWSPNWRLRRSRRLR